MKKIIMIIFVGGLVLFIDAQLRIRQRNPVWRPGEYACCADKRDAVLPNVASAEDAVRVLTQKVNDEFDKGTYQAIWGKYRRRALDIESRLGYTVPDTKGPAMEDDSFDPAYID